jgi:predicted GNAT superfamily acetyltransferase
LIAKERNQPAGFKIGYERSRETFFSWLGGVIPERRKRGIARTLMAKQHELCLSLGYEEIQTETYGDDPAMLILNLKEGFAVIGTHLGGDNRLRVQLRKKL